MTRGDTVTAARAPSGDPSALGAPPPAGGRARPVPTPAQVRRVARLARRGRPAAGRTRVIAVDGPSGAGKTTVAARLAQAFGGQVLHMDHLYPGWDGLDAGVVRLVEDVLQPLAAGRTPHVRRWDWDRDAEAGRQCLPVGDLLVVEGVGAASRAAARYLNAVVWLDAPPAERRRRALHRDGDAYAPYWDRWAYQELSTFAREGTRLRADLVIHT